MKRLSVILSVIVSLSACIVLVSCQDMNKQQVSDSGITKASVKIETGLDGFAADQRNVVKRLKMDNQPGSIKHLYIVSAYTGDVLQYSTVDGKVTSGNKRLSPKTVNGNGINNAGYSNFVQIGNTSFTTDEVIDDGGTYGESSNYIFWFDAQGNYQQYFPSGGTYLHISDKPLRIKKSLLSLELVDEPVKKESPPLKNN